MQSALKEGDHETQHARHPDHPLRQSAASQRCTRDAYRQRSGPPNFIEHPELVAQRIERYAALVGREHVIAGVDCGVATFAGAPTVVPTIAWAKLAALVEGARIASKKLWAGSS
jgi:hypothetical protein